MNTWAVVDDTAAWLECLPDIGSRIRVPVRHGEHVLFCILQSSTLRSGDGDSREVWAVMNTEAQAVIDAGARRLHEP